MPKKRKRLHLSRNTSKYRSLKNSRSKRTVELIEQQNIDAGVKMVQLHQEESEDTR